MAGRGVPEALDVEHFAQARIQELEFLDAAVAAVSNEGGGGEGVGMPSDGGPSSISAGGLRDQADGVPRHMRRRTASHKPRRMPVALKRKDDADKKASSSHDRTRDRGYSGGTRKDEESGGGGREVDARRCRKHRRRPRALLAMHTPHAAGDEEEEKEEEKDGKVDVGSVDKNKAHGGNGRGVRRSPPRWLETHIWHAKRMHMKEAWGFILPAESNRGPRASVEAALKHCTLQDETFLRPLQLLGPRRDILGVLSAVTDPLDARATRQQDCVDGFVEARTHLYRVNEFPLGCIAPVSVLWSPSDAVDASLSYPQTGERGGEGSGDNGAEEENDDDVRRVWLWVHPASAGEALREMRRACALDGAPWRGSVRAGSVPGGLCRLRLRGGRSNEILHRVLRTEPVVTGGAAAAAEEAATEAAPGDHFEMAARDNATRWRALSTAPGKGEGSGAREVGSGGSGVGGGGGSGGGPRSLPPGSVLALTALDPREQRQSRGRHVTAHRTSPAPTSSGSTVTPHAAEGRSTENVAGGGGGQEPVGVGSSDQQQQRSTVTAAAATEECPQRWAPVSPMWDPDARAFSAKLAASRPDHVINETRRRERAQEAWDSNSAAGPGASRSAAKDGGGDKRRMGSGGAVPVIVVSASGVATTAHGDEPGMTAASGEFSNGDRSGGARKGGKEAEMKRRAIASGWDLILPPGWAPVFFGALVMAGARGRRNSDVGVRVFVVFRFPADYPDTAAGRRHWDEVGRRSAEIWAKTRPKHRGFKRRLPPPISRATAPAAAGSESGRGEMGTGQDEREQQGQTPSEAEPAFRLSHFRPDFRSIAAGTDFAVASTGVTVGGGDIAPRTGKEEEREPYAAARGFQYVRAFLPDEEEEPTAAAIDEEDGRVWAASMLSSPPPPPPPPLRLAFPTVVELVITLDKGVPKPGAPIYPATLEHHAFWLEGLQKGKPWSGFSPANQNPSFQPWQSSLVPSPAATAAAAAAAAAATSRGGGEAVRGAPPALRAALGATTSGGFSFLRGGGAGRAVCGAVAARDAFELSAACRRGRGGFGPGRPRQPWALVLVGNEAGGWVRPAVARMAAS
eukprot:g10816.t1